MRESATDLLVHLPEHSNTTDLLLNVAAETPSLALYAVKESDGSWRDISAGEFTAQVSELAKGLISQGVQPGDSVAVMSRTRYEWTLADLAIMFAGGVTVPIYETSSRSQVEWILEDSGAAHVFVEDARKAALVRSAAASAGLPVQVWSLEPHGAQSLSDLVAAGTAVTDGELEAARSKAGLADVASMVYTSGTTGRPKGCEITHGNFALFAVNVPECLPEMLKPAGSSTLMFLPLAHVLARAVQMGCIASGIRLGHTNPNDLLDDMGTFRPTFLLAVPRIFEKIHAGAAAKAEQAGKGRLFRAASETAVAFSEAVDRAGLGGRGPSPALKLRHLVFDKVLFPKVRSVFGGNLKIAISGASALSPTLAHFFRGAGITVLEGYGLTETTAPLSVNTVPLSRVGSVGLPMPGTTIRIADDGEVLASGACVFRGYHNNPDATAAAFTGGWFHTGDVGTLDESGFLTITGRKKDLLVTAGGKNVAPGPLEEKIREHRLVSQVVVVGEGRPYVAALVTVDEEELPGWAREQGLDVVPPVDDPRILAQVQQAVDAANTTVSRAEQIRRFSVLKRDFSLESGHLTATLKLRRNAVIADHAEDVELLYAKQETQAAQAR